MSALPPEGETPELEAPRQRVPWAWWEPITVFMLQAVASSIIAGIIVPFTRDGDVRQGLFIVTFELALAGVTTAWVAIRFGNPFERLGLRLGELWADVRHGLRWGVVAWAVSALAVGALTTVVLQLARGGRKVPQPEQLQLSSDPSAGVLVLTGIGAILLAPIAEELFFRGLVYQSLRKRFSFRPAALISALVFMVAHLPRNLSEPRAQDLVIWPPIFVLALFFAWMFERRRSLVPSMVAHALFNGFGFAAFLLALQSR